MANGFSILEDHKPYTLGFNIAMENGPFIDDFPINISIYNGFSIAAIAMLNNQRVLSLDHGTD